MASRLREDLRFLKEMQSFSRRGNGVSLRRVISAFVGAYLLMIASLTLLEFDDVFLLLIAVSFLLFSLLAVVCAFIMEDHKAIAAVELQNAIFTGAARQISELSMIISQDGTVVYMDPEYKKRIFKSEDAIITLKSLYKAGIITRKETDKLKSAIAEVKNEQISVSMPMTDHKKSQLIFSLEPIGVYSKKERIRKLRLAVRPITRPSGYFLLRAPREEKLETVQDKKDEFLSLFAIGTYTLKGNGHIDTVNPLFEKNLGYTHEEFAAMKLTFREVFYDEEIALGLLETQENWQSVLPLRNKNNAVISAFVDHRVVKNKSGKVVRSYGVVVPFNETDMAVGDAASAEGANLDLVNNSPIATAILDTKGKVQRSNQAFRMISEKIKVNEDNLSLLDFIVPQERPEVRDLLKDVTSGKVRGSHAVDVKIDGEAEATASLYVSRIVDKHGSIKGLIAHLIDTTELKNLEMRFVHSQKMQAVGQLAGGIAHDFNNLLTAMMGFCDLLLIRHPAGDQSFADIMQIKQNANRAANLVRQLLAFSRKQTLQPKVIRITDVLADLSNLIGRLIGENIELKMEHGRDIGDVKVDQGQLEQVIINLAVNARDAMTAGGVLTIRTSNITIDDKHKLAKTLMPPAEDEIIENGNYVLIEVIDTGCGMEKEQIGKIFEPFYSTKELGAGTGLGLSTVYGIIKQTDGYVYVASKIEKGSNFSIFLKRYEAKDDPKALAKNKEEAQEKNAITDLSGKGTVLLVEDETPVRIFSFSALTSKGYTVLEAENASVALSIIEEKGASIDVIITDVVMPGMSGPDMIKEVTKQYPDIKVIFMSGYGEDAFLETFGEERKFNFLSKPYTLKQLATKVKEVVEEK